MNKRLAWNFEITGDSLFTLPIINSDDSPGIHWESRYFWRESDIIILSGLDERFLDLSRYTIKHRTDTYFLLPDADYNIKMRREALVYKPMVKRTPRAIAFGKKVKLAQCTSDIVDTDGQRIDPRALLQRIHQQGESVRVDKEALIYKFETPAASQLELARLTIDSTIYFSVSIESPALETVEHLTTSLLKTEPSSDYVTFLKHRALSCHPC